MSLSKKFIDEFIDHCKQTGARGLIVLSGEKLEKVQDLIQHIVSKYVDSKYTKLLVKHKFLKGIVNSLKNLDKVHVLSLSDVFKYLGFETDLVIVDTYTYLRPNVIAVLCEVVSQGGCLVLVTSSWKSWLPSLKNVRGRGLFGQYVKKKILETSNVLVIDVDNDDIITYRREVKDLVCTYEQKLPTHSDSMINKLLSYCRTIDQAQCILNFIQFMNTSKKMFIISGDRGRGKGTLK